MKIKNLNDRVRRSVNPNNRVKARDSSGPIPLYAKSNVLNFIKVSVRLKNEN